MNNLKRLLPLLLLGLFFSCEKVPEEIAVTSVSIDKTSLEMIEGESASLTATVKPDDATDKSVSWTTSDDSVVIVSGGKVAAIKPGKATITAQAGDKSAQCSVTVSKRVIPVTSVVLNKSSLELKVGNFDTLTATVKPDDATDKTVSWRSSDTSVATVSDGKVTAIKPGTVIITAQAGDIAAQCEVTVSPRVIPVTSVELNKTVLELIEGDYETLTATVKPDDATDKTVTWSSSDASVATVSDGKVTAVKPGTATITAKAGEKSAKCKVTVSKRVIPVTSVELNKTVLELIEGDFEILTATVKPDDATDKTVSWSSSDDFVATVSGGKVTAIKPGTATITAQAGEKSAQCKVTVSKRVIPVTSVELNKTTLELVEGDSETLTATVKPDNTTDKTVSWSTSDASVATVSGGKVTAIKPGTATITVQAGEKSAQCIVTVSKRVIPVTSVELNKTSLELIKGDSETLTATVKPDNATDKTVSWSTSDASVATVNDGVVTAVNKGTARITAQSGDKTAVCVVTVLIPVESVTLNKSELNLVKGQTETLSATVLPDNASDKSVVWSSSNDNIAAVSQNGKVTAQGGGTATITARAGEKMATCTVKVSVPAQSISLNKVEMTIVKGQSEYLSATIYPSDATETNVIWSSSDTNIAEVDEDGKVTARNGGNVKIKATIGEISALCLVTVIVLVSGISLDKTELPLFKGQQGVLSATVKPDDATDKTVSWSTSDKSVASVDQNGTVTAVNAGSATVTARAGSLSATCLVVVTIPVDRVTLDLTEKTLKVSETVQLTAAVFPEDATDKTVLWNSSAPAIASVSSDGLVKGLMEGVATITALADGKTATCTITVLRSTPGGNEGIGYDE